MPIIINPGTERLLETTEEDAHSNVRIMLRDIELEDGTTITPDPSKDYGDGRYCYILTRGERSCEVQMPGLPIGRMRLGPWKSPRLYVDGSSWLWGLADGFVYSYLTGEE